MFELASMACEFVSKNLARIIGLGLGGFGWAGVEFTEVCAGFLRFLTEKTAFQTCGTPLKI